MCKLDFKTRLYLYLTKVNLKKHIDIQDVIEKKLLQLVKLIKMIYIYLKIMKNIKSSF